MELLWFRCDSLGDPENLRHFLNQSETKANPHLVDRVFPRFRRFACSNFEFSLAPCDIICFPDWLLGLLSFLFHYTPSKCALKQATASEITIARNKTCMFHGKKKILSKKSFRKTNEKAPKWLIPDEKLSQSDWRIPVGKLTDFH